MAYQRTITDLELEQGLDLLAELIDRYGEVYWPIFDRIENELSFRKERSKKLNARIAASNSTNFNRHC